MRGTIGGEGKGFGLGFLEEGFWGFNNQARRGSVMGFDGGAEVCVSGKGFVARFQEHVEQRCVCVREGFCGAAVARKGRPEVCVCVGRVLCRRG